MGGVDKRTVVRLDHRDRRAHDPGRVQTRLALDQAFEALADASPAVRSDLAAFAAAVQSRHPSDSHRVRADELAGQVGPPTSTAKAPGPRRPPPHVKGQARPFQPFGQASPSAPSIIQADGSLRCPKCGGTQFGARRSTAMKVGFGIGSLLATPNQVQCVACGAKYKRR